MVKKQFEVSRDHWIALQQAVDESLEAIFPALKVALMRKVELVECEDPIVVLVEPKWFEDMKAALAAHPDPEVGEYYIRDIDTLLELSEDVPDPMPQGARGQTLAEFSLGLVLVVLAGIIFLALLGPAVSRVVGTADAPPQVLPDISIPEKLGELPITDHAITAHAGQKYNALNLIPMWDNDQCNRKLVYFCPKQEKIEFFCEIEPTPNGGIWGGVVVGFRDQTPLKIVTAYPDSWTYWVRKIRMDGCFMVGMP